MRTHITFHHCDRQLMDEAQAYWEKKLPRLEHLLQHYSPDGVELRLTVWHQHTRIGYQARAVLHLPTGTVVAEETAKDLHAALDATADTLVRNVKKHEEHVRHDDVYRRHRWHRVNVSAAGPLLQRDFEEGRHDAFYHLLRPVLRPLRHYAERELHLLALEGLINERAWTLDELMDALVETAWRRFAERPKDVALDVWLMDLLHELLADWTAQPTGKPTLEKAPVPALEAEVREPDAPPQTWRLQDFLPEVQPLPSWESLSPAEQRDKLLRWLSQLPRRQRQALLLHMLEDYQPSEIAVILRRDENEVRHELEQAKQHLIRCLRADGYIQTKSSGVASESSLG
ncbi:MAG: sigma factor-like helix-turn-helix DNA-binding protein [Gemmatales bacterium]|nr:HPF/RaiA family ribosome-associated protein [Gemmatales bacterium]MDW7994192.1 sigma factor-like helix-turn-helix DNA-binding protein [Gemmatales bacterium]